MMESAALHEPFMRRALELAVRARGQVGNGALVGAVLVRNGSIIAEGIHEEFGSSHAERALLDFFAGEILPDDILYVTLEPCCHHGKTPPCTDVILQRCVRTIVYGMPDPDVRALGKGLEILRTHGANVIGPVLREQCERLNRGFVSVRTKNRPYITLKKAVAADGSVANPDGSPRKITSHEQDIQTHTLLRCTHDAILVGVGTIISDNPLLDTRFDSMKRGYRPWRIILDPHLRIPVDAHVVQENDKRTMVIHGPLSTDEHQSARDQLSDRGVLLREVLLDDGMFVWTDLWREIIEPTKAYHGLTSILVEGGKKTWDAFEKNAMFDEMVVLEEEQ